VLKSRFVDSKSFVLVYAAVQKRKGRDVNLNERVFRYVTAVIEVAVNLRAVPQASEGGFQAVLVAFVKLRKQACC
jgi:hypothetical protein